MVACYCYLILMKMHQVCILVVRFSRCYLYAMSFVFACLLSTELYFTSASKERDVDIYTRRRRY